MDGQSQTKRQKTGGRLPAITPEIVDRVAGRLVKGMPLRYALAAERLGVTVGHWHQQLEKGTGLRRKFEEKVAEYLEPVLDSIGREKLRTMPASVWLLERRFPEDFAAPKTRDGVQVNVAINNAPPADAYARAARLIMGGATSRREVERVGPPKALVRGT
jgi:hypothetical protein